MQTCHSFESIGSRKDIEETVIIIAINIAEHGVNTITDSGASVSIINKVSTQQIGMVTTKHKKELREFNNSKLISGGHVTP